MIRQNYGLIEKNYKISKNPIGTGSYGVVMKCTHRETGHERAVKRVSKKKIKNIIMFKQEISILQTLDHPNVLKLYEYFEDEKYIYLVTELCRGGELFDKILEEDCFSEK